MRFLGADVGGRRIGLAWSDASGTLARAWQTVPAGASPAESARAVAAAAAAYLSPAGEHLAAVVVGWPSRLGGGETHATAAVRAFIDAMRRDGIEVHLQDERLSSHEAEARLAGRVRDWRARKPLVDAEAAAIILQDFLDGRARARQDADGADEARSS